MRSVGLLFAAMLLFVPIRAQAQAGGASHSPDEDFMEPGWFGASGDESERRLGRFAAESGGFHVTTESATAFFHVGKADTDAAFREVTGDYTVKATFREQFTATGDDPRSYGVAIASERVDSPATTYFYCAASGDGTFVVGGAGPGLTPFSVSGPRPIPHPAVHKAAAPGADVTQTIALSVRNGGIQCAINGSVVASYEKAAIVGPGRLASTDGVYGVYVGHEMDLFVTGLSVSKP